MFIFITLHCYNLPFKKTKNQETKRFENMSVTLKKGKNGRYSLNSLNLTPSNQFTRLIASPLLYPLINSG